MHKIKAKTKAIEVGNKRLNHSMPKTLHTKAVVASGLLTAKFGKTFSVTDAINYLVDKGFTSEGFIESDNA